MTPGCLDDLIGDHTSPMLERISPALYAPNRARRFRKPSILWLNERWFTEVGIDLGQADAREKIEHWLLETYAVGIPSVHDPEEVYAGPELEMMADRYGGTGGALHGGSGRCLFKGRFNVKGAGRTSLAATDTDWYHSHGCLWLEEALRETLFAELAAAVFPRGAVPVIALIDTGTRIFWDDGTTGERRALLIRPNFIRIAHLQRSLFFGTAGFVGSDQELDARRCVEVAQHLWSAGRSTEYLRHLAAFIGEQTGFARFHRLWPGPFFSSNFAVDGRLLDFGSFRSLPDWRQRQGALTDMPFGREEESIIPTLYNLAILAKRIDPDASSGSELAEIYNRSVERSFDDALLESTGLSALESEDAPALVKAVRESYATEQRLDPQSSTPWALKRDVKRRGIAIPLDDPASPGTLSVTVIEKLNRALSERPSLGRESVQEKIENFLVQNLPVGPQERVATENFIQSMLAEWSGELGALLKQRPQLD